MRLIALLAALVGVATAQLPPKPEDVKVVHSKHHPGVKITYKETAICETTPGVKSYAGHVHLPPGYLTNSTGETQEYPMNTFFWFFEARKDPENAPLAIWLNGGPGVSSLNGLFEENGPCFVNDDSRTTRLNEWSWNKEVNMLYIDQPNQAGFSYDIATNCTLDVLQEIQPQPADFSDGVPAANYTHQIGTFASQKHTNTVNTTDQAAHAMWNFGQIFFSEFPGYKPHNDKISVWAESYGGHFGPVFVDFFSEQNQKIDDGVIDGHKLHLDTLGIVSGVLDMVTQLEHQIRYAHNNSYDLPLIDKALHDELLHNFTRPGGCKDLMNKCRKDAAEQVRLSSGEEYTCAQVEDMCVEAMYVIYMTNTERSLYDITHPLYDLLGTPYMFGYFRESDVLQEIGSPVNFTMVSLAVSENFRAQADQLRDGDVAAVGRLLDRGVKVHMMYGDRDWVCNWLGGEQVSLDVPYSGSQDFARAGYEHLMSGGEHKGMTRQAGNYSFTRVFDAGHGVPSFQPRASYDIFMRAMFDKDIATGEKTVTDDLVTEGPQSTWHIKHVPGKMPEQKCYVLNPTSCSEEDLEKVISGEALVKDYFVVHEKEGGEFDGEL